MHSEKRNRIGLTILIVVLCIIAGCVGLVVALYSLGIIKVISNVSSGDDGPVGHGSNVVPLRGSARETKSP